MNHFAPFRRTVVAAWVLVLALALPQAAQAQDYRQNQIKAALVFNIIRFVGFPANDGGFRLCVSRGDPAATALAQLNRKVLGNTLVEVVQVDRSALFSSGCRVIYIGASTDIDPVRQRGVLLVGEGQAFLARGGMVAIEQFGRQMRFSISARSARQSDLTISSQLLRLAVRVIS